MMSAQNLNRRDFLSKIEKLRELRESKAPFNFYKNIYEKEFSTDPGDIYDRLFKEDIKSTVYTPKEVAEDALRYIDLKGMKKESVLDACSGTGNLIVNFLKKNEEIRNHLDMHILDTDENAVSIAVERCYYQYEIIPALHNEDFFSHEGKYSLILMNPPYLGHKDIGEEAKIKLKELYPFLNLYKSDLYYSFFYKAYDLLEDGGTAVLIVSRYFTEAESAVDLRSFILRSFRICYIHDYYGYRPFGKGVDPLIITLRKEKNPSEKKYRIPVKRGEEEFQISSEDLTSDSFKTISPKELKLIDLIEKANPFTLGDIGTFNQGIITGADKVFIMTMEKALTEGIEEELIVPWIKNKHVKSFYNSKKKDEVLKGNLEGEVLVYPPEDIEKYPGFKKYIGRYRELLEKRREVKTGKLPFHMLQWRRRKELFKKRRIIFPYKHSDSSFVIGEGVFHSADVYSYYTEEMPLSILRDLLNTKIYNEYIKLKLKKLGGNLYDYYPSNLKKVHVPMVGSNEELREFIGKIEEEYENTDNIRFSKK